MSPFDRAFEFVVGQEGGYTRNPADPGNWTGGRTGSGTLVGTKFGISAASYPQVDIAALTVDGARVIYRRDYWDIVLADQLPFPLALLLFDASVNCGVGRATRWLQQVVRTTVDGRMGPATMIAVAQAAQRPDCGATLCAEFLAQRLIFMAGLPTWHNFGLGWTRRLFRLPYESFSSNL